MNNANSSGGRAAHNTEIDHLSTMNIDDLAPSTRGLDHDGQSNQANPRELRAMLSGFKRKGSQFDLESIASVEAPAARNSSSEALDESTAT